MIKLAQVTMGEIYGLINDIISCRSDLNREIIERETRKITELSEYTIITILKYCKELALKGKPMPWEE